MKLLTKQEIQCYLNKHTFLDFWYMSKIYTLEKSWTSRISRYSLIAADALPQWRNSLDELCEQVYIDEGILLRDALNNIKVPEFDDPSWESYEAGQTQCNCATEMRYILCMMEMIIGLHIPSKDYLI